MRSCQRVQHRRCGGSQGLESPSYYQGAESQILVDTESDVTILPYDRYVAIPAEFRPTLAPLMVPLYGATGHPLDVRGTCRVPLGIGNEEILVDCTIVDGGVCPILGMNFMREHKVSLDFGSGEMRFGTTTLCLSGLKAPEAFTVKMVETLKVPAYHEPNLAELGDGVRASQGCWSETEA